MRVQICGLKTKEEVITAAYEGADALGFFVGTNYRNKDDISIDTFNRLIKFIPLFVTPILITYFSSPEAIISLIEMTKIGVIHLASQDISPEDLQKIKTKYPHIKIIKEINFNGSSKSIMQEIQKFSTYSNSLVFNLKNCKLTQEKVSEIVKSIDKPVMLSGIDITSIKEINPFGVVLNEELNGHDGFKNPDKIRQFMVALKREQRRNYFFESVGF